jgi:glycosyltransferase involved in cell wall biosynthesis
MKRIAILLPDLRGGGAERVAVNLAIAFVRRGYAVDMVLLSAKGEFLRELPREVRVVDLKVSRIRWVIFPLVRYLRSVRPTAVLPCMWPLTVIALWARALSRVPVRVVVAEHTTWSMSELLERPTVGWQIRSSMRRFFPKADGIVAVSEGAADDLARFAGLDRAAISTIYNPIVGKALARSTVPPSEPQVWCAGTHRRILAVGTLKAIKDYATLLNAFAIVRQRLDVRLLILGEGDCRPALEAQAREMGIADSVSMPGFVSDPMPYYQHADLFILSSTGEGFGNVIVEALAVGTPVVSTDCQSGPREILCDGKYGLLVPVGDASAMSEAIEISLTADHDKAALIARALDFSIEKAVDQYEKLLLGR